MDPPAAYRSVPLRLVLVRHGLSSYNLERRIQGRDDLSELSEPGFEQARLCGEALKSIGLTHSYSSPLRRARETARQLLQSHGGATELIESDDLLEIDLAPWSGLQRDELHRHDPEGERRWREEPHRLELQGTDGRPYNPVLDLMEQAGGFVEALLRRHAGALEGDRQETILVVAHNGILRCLLLRLGCRCRTPQTRERNGGRLLGRTEIQKAPRVEMDPMPAACRHLRLHLALET